MRRSASRRRQIAGASVVVAALVGGGLAAVTAPAGAAPRSASRGPAQDVIVILRNQHTDLSLAAGLHSPKARAVAADQAPVLSLARELGARDLHAYTLVNAFSAKLTATQARQLAANPSVASVVADLPIAAPQIAQKDQRTSAQDVTSAASLKRAGACPTNPKKPLLEPEALQVTHTAYRNGAIPSAHKIVTGRGVVVAYMADGVNPNNPDFIRANGRHVFVDYQDFTGEGRNAPSGAAEAFGDASDIAAQGRKVYDLHNYNTAHMVPKGCTIKVRGVAPGASLVGLKVFGNAPTAPTSRFIDAVDWAVTRDHVDVLNQSFGANPYPDNASDPISLADRAAVAAGVTVVASTGDSGVTGTIGSPSSNPWVISAAGSTTFRFYRQVTASGIQLSKGTWANNNVSALSSGGFTKRGSVPDIMAPGDLGWALCSPNLKIYEECADDLGKPSPILQFGGTSMSSPLTSGAAALVIQAYRRTHHGASPSPRLVKRILVSTATDEHHPAYEQGSGLLNTLAAVRAALSWHDKHGHPAARGSNLVLAHPQRPVVGLPGTSHAMRFTVRNVSSKRQTISASTRTLGRVVQTRNGRTALNTDTAPAFTDEYGIKRSYGKATFMVKPGVNRLSVTAAAALPPTGYALRVILIDPKGRYSAYSIPQGQNNWAFVDVHAPMAGRWTAYFAMSDAAEFHGVVRWRMQTADYIPIGTISPSSRSVAPGRSATFTMHVTLPNRPQDISASVQLNGSRGERVSMPVPVRVVVPPGDVQFRGTLTGGNGRQTVPAQGLVYYLKVPAGKRSLTVDVKLADRATRMLGFLSSPNGQVFSAKYSAANGAHRGFVLNVRKPQVGTWTLSLATLNPVSGHDVTSPFAVHVTYNSAMARAPKLPDNARVKLKAGKSVIVPIRVTNNGLTTQRFFVDPRLNRSGSYKLLELTGNSRNIPLPVPPGVTPEWLVPTETTGATFGARGNRRVNLDVFNASGGTPDLFGTRHGTRSVAHTSAAWISQGLWGADIGQVGPFAKPAPSGRVSVAARAYTKLFDPAVLSTTGDLWAEGIAGPVARRVAARPNASQPGPLVLLPGESGVIKVQITPRGKPGRVVRGHIFVDTFDRGIPTGDEVTALRYAYTVK